MQHLQNITYFAFALNQNRYICICYFLFDNKYYGTKINVVSVLQYLQSPFLIIGTAVVIFHEYLLVMLISTCCMSINQCSKLFN